MFDRFEFESPQSGAAQRLGDSRAYERERMLLIVAAKELIGSQELVGQRTRRVDEHDWRCACNLRPSFTFIAPLRKAGSATFDVEGDRLLDRKTEPSALRREWRIDRTSKTFRCDTKLSETIRQPS